MSAPTSFRAAVVEEYGHDVEAGLLEKTRSGRTVTHAVRPELFAELRTVLQMD